MVAWPDAKCGYVLKVWVSSMAYAKDVPKTFAGHPVKVELRPGFFASSALA